MNQLNELQVRRLYNVVFTLGIILTVFVAALAINAFKENMYIGQGPNPNTISVNGTGEIFAVPDIATFTFSVTDTEKTVSLAESNAAEKTNAIIAALKGMGIDEKDIKTENYSSYPKYDYTRTLCPQMESNQSSGSGSVGSAQAIIAYPPCINGKQVLTGYEVDETISVKVRKTSDAGTVLSKVGDLGATNISGLSFVLDNPDLAQAQARDKAIADAKAKAEVLANSLGVRLGKITSFSESGGYPIYYAMDSMAKGAVMNTPATPDLPTGQNKITSNVSITYEIQ